jgi:Fe-S-cluster containining protein
MSREYFGCRAGHAWLVGAAASALGREPCPRCGEPGEPIDSEVERVAVAFAVEGVRIEARLDLVAGPARAKRMLPLFQEITDRVVGEAVNKAARRGEKISCGPGCGACCRQLVPITETEARRLTEVVASMPEPKRRSTIRRFDATLASIEAGGLGERLRGYAALSEAEIDSIGLAYFALGVPCPFLVDESCSIHKDRPLACREFLVTSDPAHCKAPSPETTRSVPLGARPSDALARIDASPDERRTRQVWWLPLVLALEWDEAHPDEPPGRPSAEIANDFLQVMSLTSEAGPAKNKKKRRR